MMIKGFMQMSYTVERVCTLTEELKLFLREELPKLSLLFNNEFDPNYSAIEKALRHGVFLICKRHGEITGFLVAWIFNSPLDLNIRILSQQVFYVSDNSGRSAYHLFKKFIDFGKSEANHIITTIGRNTNIKPSTLKRWGFEELETLYRLKV